MHNYKQVTLNQTLILNLTIFVIIITQYLNV